MDLLMRAKKDYPHGVADPEIQSLKKKRIAFLQAADKGDVRTVRDLINVGIPLEICDGLGNTGVHRAARNNRVDVLKLLVEAKADVNDKNMDGGSTPIILASFYGNLEAVRYLAAEAHADVNMPDDAGDTALILAASRGHCDIPDILRFLVEEAKADIEQRGNRGFTPLLFCADFSLSKAVELLVENKADVNASDPTGCTALRFLIGNGNLPMVQLLVHAGASAFGSGDEKSPYNLACVELSSHKRNAAASWLVNYVREQRLRSIERDLGSMAMLHQLVLQAVGLGDCAPTSPSSSLEPPGLAMYSTD